MRFPVVTRYSDYDSKGHVNNAVYLTYFEAAKHALWTTATQRLEATDDALALRMAAIEAADVVFRVCHQLHGAVGFCDETQLSWLSRYSQPLRRLPFGLSATRDHLIRIAGRRGLAGLYS